MATIEIPTGTTQFNIEDEGQTYLLKDGSTLDVSGNDAAIFAGAGFNEDKVIVKGDITQTGMGFAAIVLSGEDMTLQLSKTGSINGNTGVEFIGANGSLTNAGEMTATNDFGYGAYFEGLNTTIVNTGTINATGTDGSAIGAFGTNSQITNSGTLQGAYGINVGDARMTITLDDQSEVIGTKAAIFSENTEATDKITVNNDGTITGEDGGFAIQLGDSNDKIVNHGDINGSIYLGSGKDIFDNRGGSVDTGILGGAGDDTLITSKASTKLKENGGSEGYDTVKSTVSYTLNNNVERLILLGKNDINGTGNNDQSDLFGNAGKNHLSGLKGGDTLDGGKGNDLLTGGADGDMFVFKTGYAHDTITDFENGIDRIDVSRWQGMDSFSDIKHHLTASHGDLLITMGNDQLIIEHMSKSDLNASDFNFLLEA